jgi:NAD(P)-dependent dehydrogenase (short-subunit alcohol dehydrogenase family)
VKPFVALHPRRELHDGEFDRQVAIVTGGGRGIGRTIAQQLAADAVEVYIDRQPRLGRLLRGNLKRARTDLNERERDRMAKDFAAVYCRAAYKNADLVEQTIREE